MTLADISPLPRGGGIFQYIDPWFFCYLTEYLISILPPFFIAKEEVDMY
jgi:hypothetical protein